MCGVAAIFAYHPVAPGIDRDELRRIRDHMTSRGPDGAGEWISDDGRVGLAHRRLSIIDLTLTGQQPMINDDGTVWIVFNGEIYNYKMLRDELLRMGHQFRSTSDTEVLLHLYEAHGEGMVHHLQGMFAFALWDARLHALLLVRDPYGIKPLYYADDGWTVRISSQVKALLSGGHVSRIPEPAGIAGFYLFGSIPEPFTLYQEVRSVPAGSLVRIDRLGVSQPKLYFSISGVFSEAKKRAHVLSDDQARTAIRAALLRSVKRHLVSDVPIGAFLSAGIDSGSVVGLTREVGYDNLRTVTLAFTEYAGTADDESPLALEVAQRYQTNHTVRRLDPSEFHLDLAKILSAMDQPSIDGINTYFVSKSAAELGLKVALSGLGGDELFAGYPSFRDLPLWVKSTAILAKIPGLGRLVRHGMAPLLSHDGSPKRAGLIEFGGTFAGAYFLRRGLFMPWELSSIVGKDLAAEGLDRLSLLPRINSFLQPDPGNAYGRVAALEASLYMRNQLLRDTDWASMAHSLEVRVPLVDAGLLKEIAPIVCSVRGGPNKQMIAQSLTQPLPASVNTRSKTGFSVPIGLWLEKSSSLDVWRKVPLLRRQGTHWARRWAYALTTLGSF